MGNLPIYIPHMKSLATTITNNVFDKLQCTILLYAPDEICTYMSYNTLTTIYMQNPYYSTYHSKDKKLQHVLHMLLPYVYQLHVCSSNTKYMPDMNCCHQHCGQKHWTEGWQWQQQWTSNPNCIKCIWPNQPKKHHVLFIVFVCMHVYVFCT